MFNRKHTYQYGSDPKHTVRLTAVEAHAVNNLVMINATEVGPGEIYAQVNAHEVDMKAYARAADKLNAYIAANGGGIPCTDEWLEDHDILTLIK